MVFAAGDQGVPEIEVVAINDLLERNYLAYMLKHDSRARPCSRVSSVDAQYLIVNGKKIRLPPSRTRPS